MATFANQASNLSALGSKFDRLLKVPDHHNVEISSYFEGRLRSREHKRRNANNFIVSQRDRVGKIEQELLGATINILPSSKESKTITELAELCRLTQDSTRDKLNILKSRLEDAGYMVTSPRTKHHVMHADRSSSSSPSLSRKYCRTKTTATASMNPISSNLDSSYIGGPLESVLEGEYETDGMTTPGSHLQSPLLSSTNNPIFSINASREYYDSDHVTTPHSSARKMKKHNRRRSLTFNLKSPTTPPTLDRLSISASTNSFLRHMGDEVESMYNNDEKSSSPLLSSSIGMLERVEETILEESPSSRGYERKDDSSRPSDEQQQQQRNIQPTDTSVNNDSRNNTSHHRSFITSYDDDDDDENSDMEESDDSTNVVATVVAMQDAENSIPKEQGSRFVALTDENNANKNHPVNAFQQRPTHILFDTGIASPAHTNITMDATMMNETYDMSFVRAEEQQDNYMQSAVEEIQNSYNFDNDIDNLSIETPVLDRYSLVASDSNSNCIKVVPNKRSANRSNQKRKTTPRHGRLPTLAELSPSLADYHRRSRTPKKELNTSALSSPLITTSERHLRSMNTTTPLKENSRKVYRKTPFAKRKTAISVTEEDGMSHHENEHPNISKGYSVPNSPEPFKSTAPAFSISVPPLRPRSFQPKHMDELKSLSFCTGSSSQNIDLQEEIDLNDNKTDKSILASPPGSDIRSNGRVDPVKKTIIQQSSSTFFVKQITEEEFQSAPRIVRTHVNLSQANCALFSLRKYCSDSLTEFRSLQFTEREGKNILQEESYEKSKQILISLCHWGRLRMKKNADNGIVFAVNGEN
ncbi:hypothetical protein FRACYDRAFT_241856 [Fragilariopsis cylindrus CCMP1102]|uniref:Uncharacterized protein n=1 Tax=Fragilariopsis cylindrus CCMP1102 TaxID=635003 RepID=A0A1E7F5S8_9STRA|nr:hypothetical protein FRACYDRAFT_241856 [Fragilariopsis cylindrus CCMP1102]|eukprot:OEU13522.1 hypothetical protein FRACYDRAFT_241856 [Fragilariopsis cylindrus CCMP1102]